MIGLDTNVLVRYLTQDDPIQSPLATDFLERGLTEDNPGFVSVVAMVEIVWVLESAYRLADEEIAANVERLLQADLLVIENEREVYTAMTALRDGRGSFSDALIGLLGTRAGCSHTATFDRGALRLPGFAPV